MNEEKYIPVVKEVLRMINEEEESFESERYSISQFPGTVFNSDYKCFKVYLKPEKNTFVCKITNETEMRIIDELYRKDFSVPGTYAAFGMKGGNKAVIEEYVDGSELYNNDEAYWVKTAIELAKIHKSYYNADNTMIPSSETVQIEINKAYNKVAYNSVLKNAFDVIISRLNRAPKTLIHGDMLCTNIICYYQSVKLIDWANAGIHPYFIDLGRFVGAYDEKTLKPFCPCTEKVLKAYFETADLPITFGRFEKDVKMGRFIELSRDFVPRVGLNALSVAANEKFNLVIETELNRLAVEIAK